MMAVLNTTDPIERQYLFEFFDGLFFDSDGKRFLTPEQAATYYRLYGRAAPQNGWSFKTLASRCHQLRGALQANRCRAVLGLLGLRQWLYQIQR